MRSRLLPLIAAALLVPLGCQQDAIETHRVPHQEPPPPPEDKSEVLGAVVPHANHTWFVKLNGPVDTVEAQKDAFDQFLGSMKFEGDAGADWKAPEGWKKTDPNIKGFKYEAAFTVGEGDKEALATVSKLEGEGGGALQNVNRWRGQLGLKPVSDAGLAEIAHKKDVDGEKATVVMMKGPGGGKGMGGPFAGGGVPPGHPPVEAKLGYKVPDGWEKTEPFVNGFPVEAAFKVKENGKEATATVTKLEGNGGGLLPNVNRWRGQLGLQPLEPEQLADAMKKVQVAGGDAEAVDFTGPGRPGDKGDERILAVVVPRKGQTWFIKMQGPADLVGKQKAAFDKFVGSVTFDGGNGG